MLSWPDTLERFSELKLVVIDEWHELMGTKRGVQTELALARVRKLQPKARVWGLSATIGNLNEALESLVGRRDRNRAREFDPWQAAKNDRDQVDYSRVTSNDFPGPVIWEFDWLRKSPN